MKKYIDYQGSAEIEIIINFNKMVCHFLENFVADIGSVNEGYALKGSGKNKQIYGQNWLPALFSIKHIEEDCFHVKSEYRNELSYFSFEISINNDWDSNWEKFYEKYFK